MINGDGGCQISSSLQGAGHSKFNTVQSFSRFSPNFLLHHLNSERVWIAPRTSE